jgi:hypothetical protein
MRALLLSLLCLMVVAVVAHPHHQHAAAKHSGLKAATAEEAKLMHQETKAWRFEAGVFEQGSTELNETEASNGWTLYKQCGESWSNDMLGTAAGTTICDAGCAMSSLAMALKTKGTDVNPGSLNSWLKAHGGYVGGDELVWSATDALNNGAVKFYNYWHGPGSLSTTEFINIVAKGWAVIVNVRSGTHWVLVTSHAGGTTFNVNDPGFPTTQYEYSDMGNFVAYS